MILFVLGTRAEIIKLYPVIQELDKRNITWEWVHTGQHDIESMRQQLDIKPPATQLQTMEHSQGAFRGNFFVSMLSASLWSIRNMRRLRRLFKRWRPDIVLCQGDTMANATVAFAIASMVGQRPLFGHIEAGIRSFDLFEPFPEEFSRRVTDRIADILFAPTEKAIANLRNERVTGKIFHTGNTVVDASIQIQPQHIPSMHNTVIAQAHRQENINSPQRMQHFINILNAIDQPVLLISHENLEHKLQEMGLWDQLDHTKISHAPLMEFKDFISHLTSSKGIITDSGGLMEECATWQIPCLVFRQRTERPEAIEAGFAEIVLEKDPAFVKTFLNKDFSQLKNPFGDGTASQRIVDAILAELPHIAPATASQQTARTVPHPNTPS